MAAQIRPHRLDVTDRFPMLGFTVRTDGPAVAEVVVATDAALFASSSARTSSTFYTSREHGLLSLPGGEAVYTVRADVLARFIHAERLYFGLATASSPAGADWRVEVMPTAQSPYISLSGLSDRALRRVRVYPSRTGSGYGADASRPILDWAGDRARPGAVPAPPAAAAAPAPHVPDPAQSPDPADVAYDDGFGPLPPLRPTGPSADGPAPDVVPPPPAAAAQGFGRPWSRPLDVDPETIGIEDAVLDDPPLPEAVALGSRPRALTVADYPGVSRIMPSPAYTEGRRGHGIDRIVIHITGAPQSPHVGSWFAREQADTSAHYLVDQSGEVIQFVREQDTAWHARGANRRSIGIEHVAIQQGGARYPRPDGSVQTFPYTPPTDAEYRASAELVAHLCRAYGLTPDRTTIIGHREADPTTTHSSCPDGAWDWDRYLALVGALVMPAAADLAAAQSESVPRIEPIVALDAATIDVAPERHRVTTSHVETVSQLRALAIQGFLDTNPLLTPLVLAARAAAEAAGVSVGIGTQVGSGLLAGGSLGAGVIFAPGNVTGVYGQAEIDAGFIASLGASVQVTVVSGGIDSFRGIGYSAGISGGEGLTGGAAALFDEQRRFQGVAVQVGVGVVLSPVDVYLGVQRAVAAQLGVAAALGSGDDDTVEIRYRVFIPAPVIRGPNADLDLGPIASGEDFSGDGRTFAYDGGTSRAEITATVVLGADDSMSGPTTVSRRWGESTAYDASSTVPVEGRPGWWRDKPAGLTPLRRATLTADDDNLNVSRGAPSLQRSILAVTSRSAVVSITVAGALPLVSPSPDIDADVSVYLKRAPDGGIQVMVVGDHDGFPCHELYVNRQQVYTYDPVAAGADPTNLFPPTDREISTGWVSIPRLPTADAQAYAAARTLDAGDWSVNWDDVVPVGQPTGTSCWATAAAIIDGWRRRQSVSVEDIARFDGLSTAKGLPPQSSARFAEAIGFTVHPNACYTPDGFRDLLETSGPVWVGAKVPGLHAIVVTGMYRTDGRHYVRITDPWDRVAGEPGAPGAYAVTPSTGSRYILTYDQFAAEFEAAGETEFAQLLHTGGTHGHVINRGAATGAGYAFSSEPEPSVVVPPVVPPIVSRADGAGPPAAPGAVVTRRTWEQDGRSYDLAQLSGFVEPVTTPAVGTGMPPLPGERIVLDDWPYIEGASGRTQAGVTIDWHYRDGAVGEIAVAPVDGAVLDGWTARVRADITPDESAGDRTTVTVRVTTTFSRPGEEDQVARTVVTLAGDGRRSTLHGADPVPQPEPAPPPASRPADVAAAPVAAAPQPVPA